MNLEIHSHTDPAAFLARAQQALVVAEARHCLILGLAGTQAALAAKGQDTDFFGFTLEQGGVLLRAAVVLPGIDKLAVSFPLAPRTSGPPAATRVAELLDRLAASRADVKGLLGPEEAVEALAAGWEARTGRAGEWGLRQGIYQAKKILAPTPKAGTPPGRLHPARGEDVELLARWIAAFGEEVWGRLPGEERRAVRAVAVGRAYLWRLDATGEPVASILWAGPTPRGIRVGYVYTPPEQRGRGYGSAITAALSQRLLDGRAGPPSPLRDRVFLLTDLSNPISNRIYRKMGFQKVGKVVEWTAGGDLTTAGRSSGAGAAR